jgi:sugar phosphate isomerase/epimerase
MNTFSSQEERKLKRRQFLAQAAAGALAGPLMGDTPAGNDAKLKRIGVSSWSFHNFFPTTRDEKAPPLSGKPMDIMQFPEMVADRYKVHDMEIVAPHIASTDAKYLSQLKSRMDRAHSRLVNIPVDIDELSNGGGLSDPDPKVRDKAISACTKWIDVAHDLGARSVRCDPGKMNRSDLSHTIASYKALASYAGPKGLYVIIENHGGVGSEHPEDLVKLFKGAGKYAGALPDFGNFPDETIRQSGLKLLFPYAPTVCHAKGLKFDANGNETVFDFAKCVDTSKKANFRGIYSIEFEGEADPYQGVQKVVSELLRYL